MKAHVAHRRSLYALVAASVVVCLASFARAAVYNFVLIADDTGPLIRLDRTPSINNAGTVAFHASFDAGGDGIFIGSGGPTTTIADFNSPTFNGFAPNPSINSAGTVAFYASLDAGGTGIFTGSGGAATTIADSSDFSSFFNPVINSGGTVAFHAFLVGGGDAIAIGNGGPTTILYNSNDGPFSNFGAPFINSGGTVAFEANLDAGGGGIFTGNGGPTTTVADSNGPTFSGFDDGSINDAGTVAFYADFDDNTAGIVTGNGGPTTTVAHSSVFVSTPIAPSINNGGAVAFINYADNGIDGIYAGSDPVADKVIEVGDALAGSTVAQIRDFSLQGLNDSGQVSFYADLADGRSGIFRADPMPVVPEPGSLTLCVLGALAIASGRRRRKRTDA